MGGCSQVAEEQCWWLLERVHLVSWRSLLSLPLLSMDLPHWRGLALRPSWELLAGLCLEARLLGDSAPLSTTAVPPPSSMTLVV